MVPSLCIELKHCERLALLEIARASIDSGLVGGSSLQVDVEALPAPLTAQLGVFVTLILAEKLRGCIGLLESSDCLAQSVADSAYGAAFRDKRFTKLTGREFPDTRIEVSVLSPPEPLVAASKGDILARLRPRVDGLLLEDGRHHATFLPKVWEQIPESQSFLEQLFAKAGLPADYWSETIRISHYETLCFSENA